MLAGSASGDSLFFFAAPNIGPAAAGPAGPAPTALSLMARLTYRHQGPIAHQSYGPTDLSPSGLSTDVQVSPEQHVSRGATQVTT